MPVKDENLQDLLKDRPPAPKKNPPPPFELNAYGLTVALSAYFRLIRSGAKPSLPNQLTDDDGAAWMGWPTFNDGLIHIQRKIRAFTDDQEVLEHTFTVDQFAKIHL